MKNYLLCCRWVALVFVVVCVSCGAFAKNPMEKINKKCIDVHTEKLGNQTKEFCNCHQRGLTKKMSESDLRLLASIYSGEVTMSGEQGSQLILNFDMDVLAGCQEQLKPGAKR